MLKAIKKNAVTIDSNSKIRVSYNDEKCYKCNKNNNLVPITKDSSGSVSFCKNCNIQVLIFEYIDEEAYDNKLQENLMLSRIFNPSALKRETFNNFTRNI